MEISFYFLNTGELMVLRVLTARDSFNLFLKVVHCINSLGGLGRLQLLEVSLGLFFQSVNKESTNFTRVLPERLPQEMLLPQHGDHLVRKEWTYP